MNLAESYATLLPLVEQELKKLLAAPDAALDRHYGIMQYHMGWRDGELRPAQAPAGKRVRPMLCLLACIAVGAPAEQALPAAAGLELLHNFSLIHDDIEDDSPTRRHRATAWTVFGLPLACNAGDAMFCAARLAFHGLSDGGLPAGQILRALRAFDEACVALTEGQFLDMTFEKRLDVSVDEYFRMIGGKTASLLGVAPQIGALVAGAAPDVADAYRRFGYALGIAFQLQDDVLGIWGDESLTGKSAASDILAKKKSLPVIYALSDRRVGPELRERYGGAPLTAGDIPAVLALLDRAGARDYVAARAGEALDEARSALHEALAAGAGDQGDALRELLESLGSRQT